MAPFHNAKGQPIKMSFLDLFGPSTPSPSGSGILRQERKPKNEESPASTETAPKSSAATEASTEPTTTESGSAEWTRLEEMALLGMKTQNMSWREIDEALPGKNMEDIKKRYRVIYDRAPADIKTKEGDVKKEKAKKEEEKKDEKKEEVKTDEEKDIKNSNKEKPEGKTLLTESNPWKKNQKGYKAQKGKGKAEEPKSDDVKSEEASPEETKSAETKGMLLAKANAEEKGKGGELKSINGHPVIFVDDDEELEFSELLYLYGLNARYDELKWISVDSKFFDKFGKRVGPEKLKEKLAGIL